MATSNEIAEVITRVFPDLATFEASLRRLGLQAELVQINSKMANIQAEADKNAQGYVQALDELNEMRRAKQAEIDLLEAK
jgi:glutaredoxin-related protein